MTFPFDYFEAALRDAESAIEYLNDQSNGLGRKFYNSLNQTISLICHEPERFARTLERQDLRKIRLAKPFEKSYSIYYHFDGKCIYIVSVFHNSQNPLIWQERKDDK